jgi:hypothetical protein
VDSGLEGVDSGKEEVDSGLEGSDSGPEGVNSGSEGIDSGPEGVVSARISHTIETYKSINLTNPQTRIGRNEGGGANLQEPLYFT